MKKCVKRKMAGGRAIHHDTGGVCVCVCMNVACKSKIFVKEEAVW
jgi:lipoate-protein ligase A